MIRRIALWSTAALGVLVAAEATIGPIEGCYKNKVSTPVESSATYHTVEKPAIDAAKQSFHPALDDFLDTIEFRKSRGYQCRNSDQIAYARGKGFATHDHVGLCNRWDTLDFDDQVDTIRHEAVHMLDYRHSAVNTKGLGTTFKKWWKQPCGECVLKSSLEEYFSEQDGEVRLTKRGDFSEEAFAYTVAEIMGETPEYQHHMVCEMNDDFFEYVEPVLRPNISEMREDCDNLPEVKMIPLNSFIIELNK